MTGAASELAQRLAQNAEAVCRTYFSNGHRAGGYWVVGDAENTPGISLLIRLHGPDIGNGAADKWTDAATGDHGDLLDLIGKNRRFERLRDVLDEARAFLSVPCPFPEPGARTRRPFVSQGSTEAARRLFAASRPLRGSLAAVAQERAQSFTVLSGSYSGKESLPPGDLAAMAASQTS
jgi:hypothetical protein